MSQAAWPTVWNRLSIPGDEASAQALLDVSAQRLGAMGRRLRRAAAEMKPRDTKRLLRTFLDSDTSKVGAMRRAVVRKGMPNAGAMEVVTRALGLSLWQSSSEPVFVRGEPKGSGGVRPVFIFGPEEYSRQRVALLGMKATVKLLPTQFAVAGGMKAIASWLEKHLGACVAVGTTDVPSHHLVLNRKHLVADGLLPEFVMRSVHFDPLAKAKVKPPGANGAFLSHEDLPPGVHIGPHLKGPGALLERAIPPGAASAQMVAETSLRRIFSAVESAAEGVLIASYADNIIILAPSTEAANASIKALHSAALFEFGSDVADIVQARTEWSSPASGFNYLGARWSFESGQAKRELVPGAGEAFLAKLAANALNEGLTEQQTRSRIEGWLAYHAYDPAALQFGLAAFAEHDLAPDDPSH